MGFGDNMGGGGGDTGGGALTMRFSMSRTSWLTWFRIWRQHSAACSTLARSPAASAGDKQINGWMDRWTKRKGGC